MSSVLVSGLTTITTFHLFEGVEDLFDDFKKLALWLHQCLPENKIIRGIFSIAKKNSQLDVFLF